MDAKFTPGPWLIIYRDGHPDRITADPIFHTIAAFGVTNTAATFDPSVPAEAEEECANVRLIAAAPELYEALAKLVEALVADLPQTAEYSTVLNARAAIAKAEGRS